MVAKKRGDFFYASRRVTRTKKKTHSKLTRPRHTHDSLTIHTHHRFAPTHGAALSFLLHGASAQRAASTLFFFAPGVTLPCRSAHLSTHKKHKGSGVSSGCKQKTRPGTKKKARVKDRAGAATPSSVEEGSKNKGYELFFFHCLTPKNTFRLRAPPFPPSCTPNLRPVLTRALSGAVVCTVRSCRERERGVTTNCFFFGRTFF
jgi:hypothetical protein